MRVIIALDVPDDLDVQALATYGVRVQVAPGESVGDNATVWTWWGFWADHADGRVGPDGEAGPTQSYSAGPHTTV